MRLPPARATNAIVLITVGTFLLIWLGGYDPIADFWGGFIPARFSLDPVRVPVPVTPSGLFWFLPRWLTPLSATLLHAGAIHLAFNMAMFAFCGRFVEAALRPRGLVVLYVLGAYFAALGQYLWDPASVVPMIGASGAVSAVIGAYSMLYGEQRATLANRRLNQIVNVLWMAAAWIGLQLLMGLAIIGSGISVAIAAHIGGFLAGLALARPLLIWRYRDA